MVKVFERLGHEVDVPAGQTCCGQPGFNSGYFDEARPIASHTIKVLQDADVVVIPSGSCGAMIRVFYIELFKGHVMEAAAHALSEKTFEFSEFMIKKLNQADVGAKFPHKVTFHDGCHGLRELRLRYEARQLLSHVDDLELVEMSEARTCCGFGGAFSVKFPDISTAMAEVKCNSILETGAEYVVSNDPSCLMQIKGYLDKQGHNIKALHTAEVLAQV